MKRIHGILLGLLISTVILAAEPPKAGTYSVDPAHSKVGFEVSHLVIATVEGHFSDYVGQITIGDSFEKSQFEATVQTGSVYTDQADRDKHLRSAEFLSAEEFPQARFVSTSYQPREDGTGTLQGDFTLRGVTKPLSIEIKETGAGEDPWGGYRRGYEGSAVLTLADYGIDVDLGPESKEVELMLSVEGVRQ